MHIEYYKEFAVLASLLNYSRAAEELNISQSALSKHILALEKELNTTVLNRSSRNVELSDTGHAILPLIMTIVNTDNQINLLLQEQNSWNNTGNKLHHLNIASIPVMAAYNITGIIARFFKEHPEINVSTSEYEPKSIPNLFENNRFELAFIRPNENTKKDYDSIEFCKEDIIAVLPTTHPLAKESIIQLSQLKNDHLLFIGEQAELHSICVNLCLKAGFLPKISFSGLRPENIIDLVSQNMGVSILARSFFDYYKKPNTVGISIIPTENTAISLIRKKGHKLSFEAQAFWDFVEKGQ